MGIAYNTSIVRNGLVLHLDAANIKSYPGSGTTWYDISGNGNHVTLVNGPTFSSENKGSFILDGINEYLQTANTLDLSTTNAVTVFYMLKLTTYGTSVKILHELSPNFNSYSDSFTASYSDNSVSQDYEVFSSIRGNNGYNISVYDKSLLNSLEWKSHCIIHDTSQSSKENLIYSNANIIGEKFNPLNGYAANNTNNFGNRIMYFFSRGGSGFFSSVYVGCIIIYNRALTSVEIKKNFEALRRRYGI